MMAIVNVVKGNMTTNCNRAHCRYADIGRSGTMREARSRALDLPKSAAPARAVIHNNVPLHQAAYGGRSFNDVPDAVKDRAASLDIISCQMPLPPHKIANTNSKGLPMESICHQVQKGFIE